MVFLTLFLAWPLAEIMLFVQAGIHIGFLNTLVLFGVSALAGSLLMQWQGFRTADDIRSAMSAGTVPGPAIFDTFCIYGAGILLILPGFISDAAALFLLIPAGRRWLRGRAGAVFRDGCRGNNRTENSVIEGEFTRVEDPATYLHAAEKERERESKSEKGKTDDHDR